MYVKRYKSDMKGTYLNSTKFTQIQNVQYLCGIITKAGSI